VLWLAYDSNAHPGVVDADDAVVVFLGNHERGQVGSVAGSEEDGKQRPHVGHEPAGDASRGVHVHRRSEQHRPDQPERTEQRKPVLCGIDADSGGFKGSGVVGAATLRSWLRFCSISCLFPYKRRIFRRVHFRQMTTGLNILSSVPF